MRRVVIHKPGGYERLQIEETSDLTPGPGEVLIDVCAIGVNYADCVTRMGLYASAKAYEGYPMTPGFEVAGRVAALGEGLGGPSPGAAVIGISRFNAYATQLVVPVEQVFEVPPALSLEEAAGFSVVFLTAWYALFGLAHVRKGEVLLVHSAAGGVGGALVQLAGLAGCRVVAVVGAGHKVEPARALGADVVIDKSAEDLWARAREAAPAGYHVVLDANGAETLRRSYEQLAPTGRLVVYGFHGMLPKHGGRPNWLRLGLDWLRTPRFNPMRLTVENRSVLGFNLSFLFDRAELLQLAMRELLEWAGEKRVKMPRITSYPFAKVAQAHRDLESGQTVGKLILLTPPSQASG